MENNKATEGEIVSSQQDGAKGFSKLKKIVVLLGVIVLISVFANAYFIVNSIFNNATTKPSSTKQVEEVVNNQVDQQQEAEQVSQEATNIPGGFVQYKNDELGVSFVWPDAWGDFPDVNSGATDNYEVERKYNQNLKYDVSNKRWVYSEEELYEGESGRGIGEYASIYEGDILLKDYTKVVYNFGFGDAGCGYSAPTLIHNEQVIQFNLAATCSAEDGEGGLVEGKVRLLLVDKVIDYDQYELDSRTVVESITLY